MNDAIPARAHRRGPSRSVAVTAALAMLVVLVPASPAAAATDADAGSALVVEGLLELGRAFAGTTALEPLATPVPLTAVAIRDVLELDRLLQERIVAAVTGRSTTLDDLDTILSDVPDDGMTFTEIRLVDAPEGVREWDLHLDITADLPVPLAHTDDRLRFGVAELDGELAAQLDGSFRIRFDPTAEPLQQVAVVGESLFAVTAWTRPTDDTSTGAVEQRVPSFTAVDGFVEVAAAGTVLADVALELRMRDPNGRGQLTREDLEFGIPEDLFTMAPPAAGSIAIDLELSSALLTGTSHGTVAVDTTAGPGPWPAVVVTRTAALERLSSVTGAQSLGAFASFAGAVLAVEGAVDADLPLLDARLTDLHAPGQALAALLTEQATARILCGAADTVPPSGAPRPGRPQYCQAATEGLDADTGSVSWSGLDPSTTVTVPSSGVTVGPAPDANVRIDSTVGFPHLVADFTVDGEPRRARSIVRSIQTLGGVLAADGLTGAVTYDQAVGALEVQLAMTDPDETVTVPTGGAAGLAPLTGLSGLCAATSSTGVRACPQTGEAPGAADASDVVRSDVAVTATGRQLSASLGIGLLPDDAGLDEAPEVYLRPAPDRTVWSIGDVTASIGAPAPMAARIGFLQVDVDLTALTLGTAASQPAASATVPTGPIDLYDDESRSVKGVVRVADLLAGTAVDADGRTAAGQSASSISATVARAVEVDATLDVQDAPTDANVRLLDANGTVTASWDDIGPGGVPTVVTTDGYDALRLFDLVPTVRGEITVVGTMAEGAVLTVPSIDLYRDLGLSAPTTIDGRLLRAGDDAGCTVYTVLSATTVRCDEQILLDQVWTPGDVLELEGDPDALRDGLVEDLAVLVSALETMDPATGYDETFPLLDLRPDQVSAARRGIGDGVAAVMGLADAEGDDPATAGRGPVSTLQRFTGALRGAIGGSAATAVDLVERDGTPRLELDITHAAAEPVVFAPLRISEGERLLRVTSDATGEVEDVDVSVVSDSSAHLRLAMDLTDGLTDVHSDTNVVERVTGLTGAPTKIAGRPAEYGAADWTVGAAAEVQLDIAVQQRTGFAAEAPDWTPLSATGAALTATRSGIGGGVNDCGIVGAPADAVACAVVPLVSLVPPVDDGEQDSLEVAVALTATQSSGGAGGELPGDQPLAVRFLGDGLTFLASSLGTGLDGNLVDVQLPLVGADLDAGAEIPDQVIAFSGEVRRRLPASVDDTQPLDTFLAEVTTAVQAADTPSGLAEITTEATAVCAGGTCPADPTVGDVRAVEFELALVPVEAVASTVQFSSGLPGARIDSQLHVATEVPTWELQATIGIKRGTGPYVRFDQAPVDGRVEVLTVDVEAQLPDGGPTTCHAWTRVPDAVTGVTKTGSPGDTDRCLDAVIGYLPSVLVDRGDTALDATVSVTVDAATATDDRYLPALVAGIPLQTEATGTGALDLYFEGWASELGFFDVVGTIDLTWADGAFGTDLAFGDLHLDAASLDRVLGASLQEAKEWLRTIEPVLEALSAPVPVASDLSKMTGGPDVTLLSLLVAGGGNVDLVTNLLAFRAALENVGTPSDEPRLLPLGADEANPTRSGAFTVAAGLFKLQACGDRVGGRVTGEGSSTGQCNQSASSKKNRDAAKKAPAPKDGGTRGRKMQATSKSPIVSIPSLELPVYSDARATYDLLLARQGSKMLTVDLGNLGADIGVDRAFGPFMVGPIPVFANIGGSVIVSGRFSFGFDTDGLTRLITFEERGDVQTLAGLGLDNGEVMRQGFYIEDLDGGVDVPEITLVFTLYAGASVSIGIVTAGLRGGAEIDILLDAHDPDKDGLIRIHEFAGASGRSCAFNVSSGLTFFLDFYFTIDFVIKSITKSWRALQSPRIQLFDFPCVNEEPLLAFQRTVDDEAQLVLTSGENLGRRNAFFGEARDRYTVRQMTSVPVDGKIVVEVSAFQLTQTFRVPVGAVVVADGAAGDDLFRFHPGQQIGQAANGDVTVVTVPFVLPVRATAGDGKDRIESGDGDDQLAGGAAADTISGGLGDDVLDGGDGDDVLSAGLGQDEADGGSGDDSITMGAGADYAHGGPGNDRITGGPGIDPTGLFATDDPTRIAHQLDGGDLLIGGADSDVVDGGRGSDIVIGGEYAPTLELGTTTTTGVAGVASDGQLITDIRVPHPTVVLPDESVIREECATAGTVSSGQDDVSGGFDRDYLVGGAGSDRLAGGQGDDLVCGRGGDDVLLGEGDDVLPDESGGDELLGGPGRDRLYGGPGDDVLAGNAGDDLLRGEDDDDELTGGRGADLLLGEGGADTLRGDGEGVASTTVGDGRTIRCAADTTIVDGRVDLNGDLVGNGVDDGQLEGLQVVDGEVRAPGGVLLYSGMLGLVVFVDGLADLDGDGVAGPADDAFVPLGHMTGAVGDGDCILGGDGAEVLIDGGEGGDRINAGGGDDPDVRGGAGDDLVRGGEGEDRVRGDGGTDLVVGDSGHDIVEGNAGDDRVRGGAGNDLMIGGSQVAGAVDGRDLLLGDSGDDIQVGGNALVDRDATGSAMTTGSVTLLATPASTVPAGEVDDELFGGFGDDWGFGGNGDDAVRGGPGDDVVEGGPGDDLVQGDDGDDLLVGGSSTDGAVTPGREGTGVPDGDDRLVGDGGIDDEDGVDVITGDNARLDPDVDGDRSRWPLVRPRVGIVLFDEPTDVAPVPGADAPFGDDRIDAGDGHDLVLGQSGDDTISGSGGDDAIEGNAGSDELRGDGPLADRSGDAGDDVLLGGSWTPGAHDAATPGAGDQLFGDEGDDILLGDNGTVVGTVTLLDVPAVGGDGAPGTTASDDRLDGGDGQDALYGQSGADELSGGQDDDALEGGAGADVLHGDAGDDTLVGGGSATDGQIVAARRGDGLPDGGDDLYGGDGDDVLAGDNARLVRQELLRDDGTRLRLITLFDVHLAVGDAPTGGGGDDLLFGNSGRDLVFGQGGDDEAHGGADDDVVEGNAGDDEVAGDGGEDDVLGGGSATDGVVISAANDRLLTAPAGLVAADAAGLADGADRVFGGSIPGRTDGVQADSHDVLLGDNGRITRTPVSLMVGTAAVGTVVLEGGTWSPRVVRVVAMADTAPGATSGSDVLYGQDGADDLYGQLDDTAVSGAAPDTHGDQVVPGDLLLGGPGDDALVGDLGTDTPTPAAETGPQVTLQTKGGFVDETVLVTGSLVRVVELVELDVGGDDVLLGETGDDVLHGGAGGDLGNGGSGEDALFGAHGDDALWGGLDHDRIYGGHGRDDLDVKPRTTDPDLWWAVAPAVDTDGDPMTTNGSDLVYGGFDADALQADVGRAGQVPGDRLLDWVGAFNVYYVCDSGYGAGRVQRKPDPTTLDVLIRLAEADGAFVPSTPGSSGWHELGLVTQQDNRDNNSPRHPDHPGSDNCEG